MVAVQNANWSHAVSNPSTPEETPFDVGSDAPLIVMSTVLSLDATPTVWLGLDGVGSFGSVVSMFSVYRAV